MSNKKYSNGSTFKDGVVSGRIYVVMVPNQGFFTKGGSHATTKNIARAGFFDRTRAESKLARVKPWFKDAVMVPIDIKFDFNELSFLSLLAQDNPETLAAWTAENINKDV